MNLSAEDFNNGFIGIILNDYGRVRVEDGSLLRQIDRSSLLVGTDISGVFDYKTDAESVDPPISITSPIFSDYEMYCSIDNTWSNLPPAVLAKINVYGWNNVSFAIVKFNVINMESTTEDAYLGMEFIPQLDGIYGFEQIEYVPANKTMAAYSGASTHVGYRLLSAELESFTTFDWYSGYSDSDSLYYVSMSYSAIDTIYNSDNTGGGTVSIFSQAPVQLNPSDSSEFYVAIAVGADMSTMLANMDSAVAKYDEIFDVSKVVGDDFIPSTFELAQNFPNPFNPSTKIKFSLPTAEKTRLVVSNMLGQEVTTLVNNQLSVGSYEIEFNASELPSGIYFYTLQAGNLTMTKKMVFLK
jgi:hypothetical protein